MNKAKELRNNTLLQVNLDRILFNQDLSEKTREMRILKVYGYSDEYKIGDVCMLLGFKANAPTVFTTHKVDNDYGIVYYYTMEGIEDSIKIDQIIKIDVYLPIKKLDESSTSN